MRKGGGYKNDTKLEQHERRTILIINPQKYPFYIDGLLNIGEYFGSFSNYSQTSI
jgi:hypothetical protein